VVWNADGYWLSARILLLGAKSGRWASRNPALVHAVHIAEAAVDGPAVVGGGAAAAACGEGQRGDHCATKESGKRVSIHASIVSKMRTKDNRTR
jgi:hypothetical protein